jgi:hypothetical protein
MIYSFTKIGLPASPKNIGVHEPIPNLCIYRLKFKCLGLALLACTIT